jgi:hypothetical protein
MDAQSQCLTGFHLQDSKARALALLALFACLQIADAWMTAAGIDRYGLAAESNPLLAFGVALFGPAVVLTIAKGLSVGAAVVLYRLSRLSLLALLTAMYLVVAIAPWIWALA